MVPQGFCLASSSGSYPSLPSFTPPSSTSFSYNQQQHQQQQTGSYYPKMNSMSPTQQDKDRYFQQKQKQQTPPQQQSLLQQKSHKRNNSYQQPQLQMLLSQIPTRLNPQNVAMYGGCPRQRSQEPLYATTTLSPKMSPKMSPKIRVINDTRDSSKKSDDNDDDKHSITKSDNNDQNAGSITGSNDTSECIFKSSGMNENIFKSNDSSESIFKSNDSNDCANYAIANSNDAMTNINSNSTTRDNLDTNTRNTNTNSTNSTNNNSNERIKKSDEIKKGVPLPSPGDFIGDDADPERYLITKVVGRGVFSSVFSAHDQVTQEDVALKLIRNTPEYSAVADNEIKILGMLNRADPTDDFNIQRVRYNHSNGTKYWFTYKGAFVCIVTELLSDSLYNLLEKTSFYGVSLHLIRNFARQVLVTLTLLRSPDISVVHCDLKPENILISNPKKLSIKVIDFGSSVCDGGTFYKYAQSRFYRAPEVILRLPYKYPVDMWSLACILFELYMGVPLFQGRNEGEQLAEFASYLGLPPEEMIIKSPVAGRYFVPSSDCRTVNYFEFVPELQDRFIPRRLTDTLGFNTDNPDNQRMLRSKHSKADYLAFIDLLEKMLVYDPEKRITPQQALKHNFFTEK